MLVMHETETARQPSAPRRAAGLLSVDLVATQKHGQDAAVLSVRGEIDLGTTPLLREALLPVLERETGPVVVDLSEVAFMDSTGVHVLVETLRRLESQNRPLAIVCRPDGHVHQLLALVGMLDVLCVHRSRESAVTGGGDILRTGSVIS
jgi:anti-sigma B factor antagonist